MGCAPFIYFRKISTRIVVTEHRVFRSLICQRVIGICAIFVAVTHRGFTLQEICSISITTSSKLGRLFTKSPIINTFLRKIMLPFQPELLQEELFVMYLFFADVSKPRCQ